MPDTLYYDGYCPLCAKEIARLRELSGDSLVLLDIHETQPAEGDPSTDALLRDLHLRTSDGTFLSGVDANVAAWQHTRLGYLWRWLRWPLIKPIAGWVYQHWAGWRYRRLYGAIGGPGEETLPQ